MACCHTTRLTARLQRPSNGPVTAPPALPVYDGHPRKPRPCPLCASCAALPLGRRVLAERVAELESDVAQLKREATINEERHATAFNSVRLRAHARARARASTRDGGRVPECRVSPLQRGRGAVHTHRAARPSHLHPTCIPPASHRQVMRELEAEVAAVSAQRDEARERCAVLERKHTRRMSCANLHAAAAGTTQSCGAASRPLQPPPPAGRTDDCPQAGVEEGAAGAAHRAGAGAGGGGTKATTCRGGVLSTMRRTLSFEGKSKRAGVNRTPSFARKAPTVAVEGPRGAGCASSSS